MSTIEMKMANIAASNWGSNTPNNLDEAKKITGGSEISAIKAIISILELNPELESKLLEEVYTKEEFSPEMSKMISQKMLSEGDSSKKIVEMLSIIHDGWVKSNPNKFLQEGRNKEYQFVPLMLLNYNEANSDLIFLKPILEAAGVEVDETKIQQKFEDMQQEFLIEKNITSESELKNFITEGSKSYEALEGLETQNGGNICELLKSYKIVELMSKQILSQIDITPKKELSVGVTPDDSVISFSKSEAGNFTSNNAKLPEGIDTMKAEILEAFTGECNEFVAVFSKVDDAYENSQKQFVKVMPKKQFEVLVKYGMGWCHNTSYVTQGDGVTKTETYVCETIDECDEEIKPLIEAEKKKIEEMRKNSKSDSTKHVIKYPIYGRTQYLSYFDEVGTDVIGEITMNLTDAELLNAGIEPEKSKEKNKKKINLHSIKNAVKGAFSKGSREDNERY